MTGAAPTPAFRAEVDAPSHRRLPILRPEQQVFFVEQEAGIEGVGTVAGQIQERLRGGAAMTTSSIEALRKLKLETNAVRAGCSAISPTAADGVQKSGPPAVRGVDVPPVLPAGTGAPPPGGDAKVQPRSCGWSLVSHGAAQASANADEVIMTAG